MDEVKPEEQAAVQPDSGTVQPEAVPPPAPESPASAEPPTADPRDEEIAALKDRLLRLQADFENFRKRTVRDRDDQARRACEKILKDLLPVVDHFDLGVQSAHKHHIKHAVIEGFEGVQKQFHQALEKAGVMPIETLNQPFDPHLHESVAQVHSEEHPENTVIQETRRGYRLGAYVLRAAQVIVSKGPASPATEAAKADNDGTLPVS